MVRTFAMLILCMSWAGWAVAVPKADLWEIWQAGEQVVVRGNERLRPGDKVRVDGAS